MPPRPFLVGTLGALFFMSLAAAIAWQRHEPATVAWLIWPASVAGAVIAERLMRFAQASRQLRREAEEVQRALEAATARQAELMAVLRRVREDAHRVAQPLTAAMGYTELLERRCRGQSPACDQQIALLHESLNRLAQELDDLRTTARSALG